MSDRDKYRPKTPPPGVLAQVARPETNRQPISKPEGLERDDAGDAIPRDELSDFDMRTPVYSDPFARMEWRQRRSSLAIVKMGQRLDQIEPAVRDLAIASRLESATREDRSEAARLEREAAEDRKERREAAARIERRESRKMWASILVPTITAILMGIAAIITVMRSPATAVPIPTPVPAVSK